ncbi:MAG: winged helix-turn-helix domain-containing tetratricopeptide repeat protein [Bacteroidales bacterium]
MVRFDCFEVDLDGGQIYKRGARLHLREQPFRVLAALLGCPGSVVTREDLRRRLWPDGVFVDFDGLLNTAVATVREVLGDSAAHPRFIETLPKHGYRFIVPVSPPLSDERSAAARKPRLLVLPFVNSTGDAGQDYLSDATTEEIITALAGLAPDMLAVIARTTAMHYKGSQKHVAAIAREVSVDYIVEGALLRAGGAVALTAQLIRASDQSHVWAKRYESTPSGLFNVHSAIAQEIGKHLGIARPEQAADRRKPTADLVAYKLYLEGLHDLSTSTATSLADAKLCFEKAIVRDPQFALAYDALAELHWYLSFLGFAAPSEVSAAGMFYALRALEIDNNLAETHALLAMFRADIGCDKSEIKRALERARQFNPSSPLVKLRCALAWLMPTGRLQEAIAEVESALESDPFSMYTRAWFGCFLWLSRQYDRAIEQAHLMVEIEPDNYLGHWHLGMYCCDKGAFDESIAAHRMAVELSGGSMLTLGWFGLALGKGGRTTEAREVLDRLHAAVGEMYVQPTSFAWTYLGLGAVDDAFVWMDRAADGHDRMLVPVQAYPFLDPLRTDPRYAALLAKMRMRPPAIEAGGIVT